MTNIRFKDYLIDYLEYNNITNKDFANRLGISQKHLIDILSGERDLSSSIIEKISMITSIPIDYIYRVEANYRLRKEIDQYLLENDLTISQYLNKYHYKYLIEKHYLDFVDIDDKMEIMKDILKFLRVSSPKKVYQIDKTIYYKSKNDKKELLVLWLEKCYRGTLKQTVLEYQKGNIEKMVDFILKCAKEKEFDEEKLVKEFNKNGIYFVIEDDIPGAKIRGAFRVHRGKPAIYLTRKHRRIADIYFALLHELAHCKTDFNKAQASSFVSYEDEVNESEQKADDQAFNWMVENSYYKEYCVKDTYEIEEEQKYPTSFVVYRLAHDNYLDYSSKEYQKYNFLLPKDEKESS